MLIGNKYQVRADPLQYILEEKRINRKNNTEYWVAVGYFSTLQNALKHLVNLNVRATELKDLETVVERMEQIYKEIKAIDTGLLRSK